MTTEVKTDSVPAVVSMRDIYIKLDKLEDTVTGYGLDDMKLRLMDHENRIRQLEKMIWQASGAAAIGGALISFIVNELMNRGA